LPFVFFFKEPKTGQTSQAVDFKSVYKKTLQGLRSLLRKNKNVTTYLLSFMLTSDALLTANLYFAIYLDQVYHMTDTQKLLILVLMEAVAVPSAYIIGKISDTLGIKRLLVLSCVILILVFISLSLSLPLPFVYVLSGLLGVGFGGFFTTARGFLVKIAPPAQLGEYFGFYATFERFASIIGPMTWGAVTLLLRDYGVMKYRVAILALAVLMFAGLALLRKVKEEAVV